MKLKTDSVNINGTSILLRTLILASVLSFSLSARIRNSGIGRIPSDNQEHLYVPEINVNRPVNHPEQSGDPTNSPGQLSNSDINKRRPIILDLNTEYVPESSDNENSSASSECGNRENGNGNEVNPMDEGAIALLLLKDKEIMDNGQNMHEEPSSKNSQIPLGPIKWGCKGRRGYRRKKLLDSLGSMNEPFVI